MTVTCPYCNQPAKLVTGAGVYKPCPPDLLQRYFWRCDPCDAHVGCHRANNGQRRTFNDGTVPLGRLADAKLRMWKGNAHAVFDGHWQRAVDQEIAANGGRAPKGVKQRHRTAAYERLAKDLGIEQKDCHIGMFDVETCQRAVRICVGWMKGAQA
ncbi:zinc-finger-containing protein [Massilia sp. TN1-12]|uniref:zinc-finger-containing protein n=1 Tax=Massilia paldalensis TaxID=3377675 RepID=UPI00384F2CC7